MIHIDSKKGILQMSGSLLTLQTELSALLREFRKEIDPEHGDELINEMVRVSKLTDEEMNKEGYRSSSRKYGSGWFNEIT